DLFQNLPGPIGLDAQTFLHSDAANVLALRNSTNAQAFRVYNTYMDASNNEFGRFGWQSNVLQIGTVSNGAGSARDVSIIRNGVAQMSFGASSVSFAYTYQVYLNNGVLYGGSSGSSIYGFRQKSEHKSATGNVNAGRSMATYTNQSASGAITLTLPTLVEGYDYKFVDDNASYRLTVKPNTSDQIIWTDGTVVSAATGSVVSTSRYDSFWGVALDATTFKVMCHTGTWTVTP
ncbi:MAG: hypothetical protein KDI12_05620, partial [Anaerolineae bacterium]|nr:hypothetical protein [Anaerolineae bacterium]